MTEEEKDLHEDQEVVLEQQNAGWFANAPWWLVSAGIHAVLILGATLVAIEKLIAVEPGEIAIVVNSSAPKMFTEMERKRDVFDRAGIPKDEPVSNPSQDVAIFFPEAELSDHNESADNEDYGKMKGDSEKFLSYIKGEAGGFRGRQGGKDPGVYDTMGVGIGGGGGGRHGGAYGGRFRTGRQGSGTTARRKAPSSRPSSGSPITRAPTAAGAPSPSRPSARAAAAAASARRITTRASPPCRCSRSSAPGSPSCRRTSSPTPSTRPARSASARS
jgi:hypothetical protein